MIVHGTRIRVLELLWEIIYLGILWQARGPNDCCSWDKRAYRREPALLHGHHEVVQWVLLSNGCPR